MEKSHTFEDFTVGVATVVFGSIFLLIIGFFVALVMFNAVLIAIGILCLLFLLLTIYIFVLIGKVVRLKMVRR